MPRKQTYSVRVEREAAQKLWDAIVRGGYHHGRLTQECSIALRERAEKLDRELKEKQRA